MLDNALLTLVIQVLVAGEAAAGIPGTPIAQSFQPTQQGTNSAPTLYLQKLFDHRYGFTGSADAWNGTALVHTQTQQYETTLQISALAQQDPATPTQMTASDLLNLAAAILSSAGTVQALQDQGVGIERITGVRNPPFRDDYEHYEFAPSFDVTFTHKQTITTTTPAASSVELQLADV